MKQRPQFLTELRSRIANKGHKQRLDEYFELMGKLQTALKNGEFSTAKQFANRSWAYIDDLLIFDTLMTVLHAPDVFDKVFAADIENQEYDDVAIRLLKKQYPDLNANTPIEGKAALAISSIPCIDEYGHVCAVVEEGQEIARIREIVEYYSDLARWKNVMAEIESNCVLTKDIMELVRSNPGIIQKDLKKYLPNADGRTISGLCYQLQKFHRLQREKVGTSYCLNVQTG